MAQKNKNPKKDLEKRVAKLKKKVGTLTTSLSKKQSDLSRVLSSVQKQLEKLRKQNASGKVGASHDDRQQELLQTTESLLARLHDLEQTVSIVERAGDELRARTDALEVKAAEAARESQQRLQVAGEPDGSLQHGLELLRDRTQAVEDHLVHLSGAQESLELQIALLSREAEGDSEPAPVEVSPVGPDPAWIERANELSAQIEAVRKSVADETQDAARLSAHSQQLEAFATQLGQLEQALQDRVERLEQQDSSPGDAPELARQIPEFRNMCSRTEEAAGKLSRRTAVLEAGYKGLVEKETRIASRLEALEKRLSEPKTAPEVVGPSVPAKIPQALEQQVALLSTDRSLHKARIDQVMQRTDELEKTGLDFRRHTDALADRIAALDDGLQALNAEGRLDELDRRGNTLERLLDEEKERIGALTKSEEALDRRLAAAIGDVEALLGRVDALDSGKGQLNKEIDRLDGALRDAAEKAKRQQDLLQTHAAQLEKQREDLADAVLGQKKTSEALNGRLATLDESSQALLESADGLKVQQVRQDQDTRTLQQKLQRRSLLGLLMFLLAGGVLVYLLMRGPVVPEGSQSPMQAGSLAEEEAKAAIADLEKDTGSMRLELSEMRDSFSEVVRLLDEVSITASAALHSEQLNELTQAMEALGREDQEQRQRHEALQKIQGQQQQERVELQKAQEQLQQQDAELLQGQQRLQAELGRIAEELKALKASAGTKPGAKAPVRKPATEMKPAMVPAPARTMAAPAWAEAGASGRYTLQLAGFYQPASLAWFVERHHLGQDSAVYHTEFQGRKWYVVFHGIYDTIEQAVAAASDLPPELAAQNPWVRRIPQSGDLFQP